jgi:hypothetical protein
VAASLSTESYHLFRPELSSKFEDGTVNFLSILSLKYGLKLIQTELGGIMEITK